LDNRRLLIAALLSMGVLLLWQYLVPPPEPPRPPQPAPASAAGPAAAPAPGAAALPEAVPAAPAPSAARDLSAEPVEAEGEARIVLENAELRAEFTNRGAQLVSLVVKGKTADGGEPLELVRPRPTPPYPFALLGTDGNAAPIEAALYAPTRSASAGGEELVFRYRGALGAATKRFLLHGDGRMDFAVEADAGGFGLLVGPGLRAFTRADLDNRQKRRSAVWAAAGEVEVLDARAAEETLRLPGAGLEWIGLEDAYFLSVLVPEQGVAEARLEPLLLVPTDAPTAFAARPFPADGELGREDAKLPRELRLVLAAANGRIAGTSYWGPKQYDRLAATPWGLERTVQWGWLGVIARPMLRALQWIHAHLVPNYGWSIVILTTILKIALLPLSISAFKSMRKMQKLNPRMQAIREKWRGKLRDKQGRFNPEAQRQMNEEIMGLYRQEGANPAGGCLPILVQLPIFFAFYTLLSTTVELWNAPWIGWIKDLSEHDPYFVLPILMGVSQVVQQRMTPPPPDPVQRKIIQAMPVVFTFFSLWFASGLVLYWLTNNLWSIVQQMLYNSFKDHHPESAPPAPAKGGRKA
jgi:YidC/Oxa1 family membrane protein insertase